MVVVTGDVDGAIWIKAVDTSPRRALRVSRVERGDRRLAGELMQRRRCSVALGDQHRPQVLLIAETKRPPLTSPPS